MSLILRRAKAAAEKYGLTLAKWQSLTRAQRTRLASSHYEKNATQEYRSAKWARKRANRKARLGEDEVLRLSRESYARDREARLASRAKSYRKRKSKTAIVLNPDVVYRQIMAAIPRVWPRHVRDDIAGEMCLAVLEGKILVTDIDKEVRKFMTVYNRVYETYRTTSLDAPVAGTDNLRRIDTVSEDQGMWK